MSTEIEATLRAAVEGRLPVHLISIRHEARFVGVLVDVGADGLLLELGPGHPLTALDMVSASFSHGPRTYTFLANVLGEEDDRVWLSEPRDIVSADRRISPRVAVTVPVEVELRGANPHIRPSLVDIALTGMRVAILSPSGLTTGERVPVVLSFEGREVEVVGELRHQTDRAMGFFFPDSIRKGRLVPPAGLVALVERIRRG